MNKRKIIDELPLKSKFSKVKDVKRNSDNLKPKVKDKGFDIKDVPVPVLIKDEEADAMMEDLQLKKDDCRGETVDKTTDVGQNDGMFFSESGMINIVLNALEAETGIKEEETAVPVNAEPIVQIDTEDVKQEDNTADTEPKKEIAANKDAGVKEPKVKGAGKKKKKVVDDSTDGNPVNKSSKYFYCSCHFSCKSLTEEDRADIFNKFRNLKDWQEKTVFIIKSVVCVPVKRRIVDTSAHKFLSRQFFLNDVRVCKKVFLTCLGITNSRLDYALRRKANSPVVEPDQRGQFNIHKTRESQITLVKTFLNSFPKYKTHNALSQRQYFHPDLTYSKLYELYVETLINEKEKVSYKAFRKISESVNVSIFVPKKDFCQTCDRIGKELKTCSNEERKQILIVEEIVHLEAAESGKTALQMAMTQAKLDLSKLVFTFDMQKPQPFPCLNASVAYFKRQMWLFSLGISTRHNNQGYMCVWNQTEGKRGTNEVCSSIWKFLENQDCRNLESFSSNCVGQNCIQHFAAFMTYVCEKNNLQTWTHTFLESGHSSLPNDADFGIIEKQKKVAREIYSQDSWIDLIEMTKSRKPLKVIRMGNHIKNFRVLANEVFLFRNRNDEESFSWQHVKWLRVTRGNGFLEYSATHSPQTEPQKLDFWLRNYNPMPYEIPSAYPDGIKISAEKFKDLLDLLPYIPPNLHECYTSLPHESSEIADDFFLEGVSESE